MSTVNNGPTNMDAGVGRLAKEYMSTPLEEAKRYRREHQCTHKIALDAECAKCDAGGNGRYGICPIADPMVGAFFPCSGCDRECTNVKHCKFAADARKGGRNLGWSLTTPHGTLIHIPENNRDGWKVELVVGDERDVATLDVAMLIRHKAATPLCHEHMPTGGTRGGCVICAQIKLSGALSRIDYACGPENDQQVSDYDVHCDEDAVVAAVVRMRRELETIRAELKALVASD